MTRPTEQDDPLMDLAAIAAYSGSSVDWVRRRAHLPSNHPEYLAVLKHAGKLKARRSVVNAWIDACAEVAARAGVGRRDLYEAVLAAR